MALALPATSGITSTMTAALATAQTALTTAIGNGTISDLSLTQLQNVINSFEDCYNVYLAGLQSPMGVNLDTYNGTGASTKDGFTAFATEAGQVVIESDVMLALFYLGRVIGNLQLDGG